jgi:anti-anti-sigma factor
VSRPPRGRGLRLPIVSALSSVSSTSPQARAAAIGPRRFRIEEGPQDGQRVLRLHGELDVAAAPTLRARVTELALQDGVVIIDLSAVEFVDVAGLCALHALVREAHRGRWLLELRHAPISVRQLARMTGMRELELAA